MFKTFKTKTDCNRCAVAGGQRVIKAATYTDQQQDERQSRHVRVVSKRWTASQPAASSTKTRISLWLLC